MCTPRPVTVIEFYSFPRSRAIVVSLETVFQQKQIEIQLYQLTKPDNIVFLFNETLRIILIMSIGVAHIFTSNLLTG